MIRLEKVNEDNFKDVISLHVKSNQEFYVAKNVVSIAQAWLYPESARPFAIMDDDKVIGFVMLDWDEEERTVGIWRFMIGEVFQGNGFGKKSLSIIIDLIRNAENIDAIYLDYVEGNDVARNLYYSFGFRENGKADGNEKIMVLPLTDKPKVAILTADVDDLDDFESIIKKESLTITMEELKTSVENEEVIRIALLGETIGFVFNDNIFLLNKFISKLEEAKLKVKKYNEN